MFVGNLLEYSRYNKQEIKLKDRGTLMIDNKHVIGVCITKIHDSTHAEIISYLHKQAEAQGYKLIVFNSSFDFFYGLDDQMSASQIYDFINFDIIDALIIFCGSFLDKTIYHGLINRALEANIPVLLEDEVYEGCITIKNEYDQIFKDMIRHVIEHHDVKDLFFMAGFKGNEQSDHRIKLYKEVLQECNIPFTDDMLAYGDFWEYPTAQIMRRLYKEREHMPGAIICANDVMGVEVCKQLKAFGYRVPEDVIVTGFDDSIAASFAEPTLTSCAIDWEKFIDQCLELINKAFHKECVDKLYYNFYQIKYRQSCGCKDKDETNYEKLAKKLYDLTRSQGGQELYIYNTIIYLLNTMGSDNNVFYSVIASIMYENSYLAILPSCLAKITNVKNEDRIDDRELIIFESKEAQNILPVNQKKIKVSDMIPQKELWVNENTMYVISAVQIGKSICGYFEDKLDDIVAKSPRTNRVLNLISILIHMASSDIRQRYFKLNHSEDALVNPVSELYNLHGADHWYEDFISKPRNKDKLITVSVYKIYHYEFIYETYGIKDIEAVISFVAEALKMANPNDCLIAHITDDTFAVINYYDDVAVIGSTIDRATAFFYNLLGNYNQTNGLEYNIDVSCGCVNPIEGPAQKLETLIKYATNEMYRNRTIYGYNVAVKDKVATSREQYALFEALVSNNLFLYHFQPIVSAKDGEIYAYEALMRTDSSIGMNPFEVLTIANDYKRLYDIEKATLFNVMKRYTEETDKFEGKKVFVNCIPGYFLNAEDRKALHDNYNDIFHNFVFEITEQDTLNEDELNSLRNLENKAGKNMIAIDDYGVGHSNIVNLIKYKPDIVKIDRFLLTDIHLDEAKQLVVKGVIEFAEMHDIKVLAEGIETEEELCKVIEMGVDYIQGYYTGRPSAEPISAIDEHVKSVIKRCSVNC